MNNISKEIATQIESHYKDGNMRFNIAGLNKDQLDMVSRFVKAFNRNGYIPFPLKLK